MAEFQGSVTHSYRTCLTNMFAGALQPPRVSEQEPDDDGDELLLPPSTTCPKKQGERGQCTESNRLKCRPPSRPGVNAFCTCSREVCVQSLRWVELRTDSQQGTRRSPGPPALLQRRTMLLMFKCNEVTSYHRRFISVLTHRRFQSSLMPSRPRGSR